MNLMERYAVCRALIVDCKSSPVYRIPHPLTHSYSSSLLCANGLTYVQELRAEALEYTTTGP